MSVEEKIKKLPDSPGVYTYYNLSGDVIYVGKAKVLKNRVRQYFQRANQTGKTAKLVENIADVSWIVTDNETEALLLECNLIKQYRPRYNILLKDDKSFPFIKLTLSEEYPRLLLTRKRTNDGDKYFGPYANSYYARKTIEALNRYYPVKMCSKSASFGKTVGKVCLNHHIHQCCAPCTGNIKLSEYMKYINEICEVLSGNYKVLLLQIETEMNNESDKLNYETASYLKELNECVRGLNQKQKISTSSLDERDIIAIASDKDISCIQLFFVREGHIAASDIRYMKKDAADSDCDVLESFLKQYYMSGVYIPREVLIPFLLEDSEALCAMLTQLKGTICTLHTPKIGDKKRLMELAEKNAKMNIDNRRSKLERQNEEISRIAKELSRLLNIKDSLKRIECYDISNISGSDNVGVMTVYDMFKKSPSQYRRFRIKYVSDQNDYASTAEVVFRRLSRAKTELDDSVKNAKFLPLPQLIFADGGKSHVNTINSVIKDFGYPIVCAGLVKDAKHKLRAVIDSEGNELSLNEFKHSKKLLNEMSEEVHRFAIEYHRASRSKTMLKTQLEEIDSIGKQRCLSLMKHFSTIEAIKKASVEELCKADKMNEASAKKVYEYFNVN